MIKKIIETVIELSPVKDERYSHPKNTIEDYAIGIIEVSKNCISWNKYIGKINSDTLRLKYNEWVKLGVFSRLKEKSQTRIS